MSKYNTEQPLDVYLAWPARLTSVQAELEAMLDGAETERLRRLAFAEDRLQYAAAHALARAVLAARLGCAPAALPLGVEPGGRPVVRGAVAFSLSRRRRLVAVAVSGAEVGVDVEDVSRRVEGVAEAFFPPAEAAALAALPPGLGEARFFEAWTLKEAWLKAQGTGLSAPLASVPRDRPGWTALGFRPDPFHAGAVVARGAAAPRFHAARLEAGGGWRLEPLAVATWPARTG